MEIRIRQPKQHEKVTYSFPSTEADLTDGVITEHRMGGALKRFGLALLKQLRKSDKTMIGVKLHRITFTVQRAEPRTGACTEGRRAVPRADALAGHCGACKQFRRPGYVKRAKKRKK